MRNLLPWPVIAGAVGVGALLNVAVAWSGSVATDLGRSRFYELYTELPDDHHWEVYRWESVAGTRVFSKCWSGLSAGPYNHGDPDALMAGWGRAVPPDRAAPRTAAYIDEGWGVPMRTMRSHIVAGVAGTGPDDPGTETSRHGVLLLREGQGFERPAIHLPLLPVWTGLLVNTICYALVLIIAWAVGRDVRQWIRRHRAPSMQP